MAKASNPAIAAVLPTFYWFVWVVFTPFMLGGLWVAALLDKEAWYDMQAPPDSQGILFKPSLGAGLATCTATLAWNTPAVNVMLYQLMTAHLFSTLVECVTVHCARYKMRNPKDAETAIWCIETTMLIYDWAHIGGLVSVVGTPAVVPGFSWSSIHGPSMFATWCAAIVSFSRVAWLYGVGREFAQDKSA